MIADWVYDYIGLQYKDQGRDRTGLDCWGLVRLVLFEQFDIDLPSYTEEYEDPKTMEKAIEEHTKDLPFEKVETGELGDVVVLRQFGNNSHVGLFVGDNKIMHVQKGIGSVLADVNDARWRRRIIGIYRYKK